MTRGRGVVPGRELAIALWTTALVIAIALFGTRATLSGITPWPRFWAITFFALLLWPVGLTLCGYLAGPRVQLGASVLVIAFSVAQQLGAGTLPIPLVQSWSVSLIAPGDAIRREITLPAPDNAAWGKAWQRAASVAIAVCTDGAIPDVASLTIHVNEARGVPLGDLRRADRSDGASWYFLPVTRREIDARRPLVVDVRREGPPGLPARICGGQDDPTRPGWHGSLRLSSGRWSSEHLTDEYVPLIYGRPAPGRYYVELRFFAADGRPHVGIWY